MNNLSTLNIKDKIYTIRGMQVMLDRDLAEFYGVETKNLNKSVKRNIERFPNDFMFQLTKEEFNSLRFQNGTIKNSQRGEHRKYLPYVFTEQGVATLSGILKSKRAIEVNIQIMRTFISIKNYLSENKEIFNRLDKLENNHNFLKLDINKIFKLLENTNPKPDKGVFFDGQLFDSHVFISDLIRSAKYEIKLVDNYVDERTLNLFKKRRKGVKLTIYTKNLTQTLIQDLDRYNSQYEPIIIKQFNLSHDRFLIIDNQVYHIGASLKDAGKKWFGFSKMSEDSLEIIKRIENRD